MNYVSIWDSSNSNPPKILVKATNRDKDSTRLFDPSYTWCAARANPWEEAHWRGHVPSACHSTNHLGEGLREEPIVALAGHHLNPGERVNRKHGSVRAGVAGEAGWQVDASLWWLGSARGWRLSAMNELGQISTTQFRLLSPHVLHKYWTIKDHVTGGSFMSSWWLFWTVAHA